MNPVTMIVVPGFFGGLVLAIVVILLQRRQRQAPSFVAPPPHLPISTDVINMASIKVAGVGGLGLVAMAFVVAMDVPMIGLSVALGFIFGLAGALAAILRHRRTAPLPSSGRHMGANDVLSIDCPQER